MKISTNERRVLTLVASTHRIQRIKLIRRMEGLGIKDDNEQQAVLDKLQIELGLIDSRIESFTHGERNGKSGQFFFATDAGVNYLIPQT